MVRCVGATSRHCTGKTEVGRKGGQKGLSCWIFSAYSYEGNAGIAQLVEQLICNQQVVGSNPTAGFWRIVAFPGSRWLSTQFQPESLHYQYPPVTVYPAALKSSASSTSIWTAPSNGIGFRCS